MKFKIQDLLTLLIGLFLFASCKNSSTIGLDLDPNTAIQGTLIDTLSIHSKMEREENIQTHNLGNFPLGYMNDPIFGKTESSLAITVNLPSKNYDFGTNPQLDSAVLVLNYAPGIYGDTAASVYSVDVRRLANDISKDESFLSTRVYNAESALLGNKTSKIYPTTRFKIIDIVPGKPDTLKSVAPQLRIKLDKTMISDLIVGKTSNFSNSDFVSYFKGLKVSLNKTNSTGNLGVMFFDFESGYSQLEVYYRKQNATTATAIDTIFSTFPISTKTSPIGATVNHDYTGTVVQTQLSNTAVQYPVNYLQGLGGVRSKISFPYLEELSKKAGNIIINKAELVIDIASGTDAAPYLAPPRLALYRKDIAGQKKNIKDHIFFQNLFGSELIGDAAFGGYFDGKNRNYVFIITGYVQDLIDGKDKDYGTYLAVTPETSFSYLFPSYTTAARLAFGSGAKNAAGSFINPNSKMKLNIYYTKIN